MPAETAPIPFSDPPYLLSLPSPYFTPSHLKWQAALRPWLQTHLHDHALEWDQSGTLPPSVFAAFAKANLLPAALPSPLPVAWLKKLGIDTLLNGAVKVEEFDALHGYIFGDEMVRSGLAGPGASLTTGMAFGVPLILKFGSEELKERVLPGLLRAEKRACIAITEPDAGSDVAGILTTAVRSDDGREWIVNGTKKWITNGIWSDYASMAVRTGPPGSGAAGISLLVVPLKNHPGVTMRRLSVSGTASSGTTYIELDDVRVPITNLIGEENQGMRYIMTNFNHERLAVATGATRQARVALSTAFEYVLKREAFGRPLIDQPVVRHRLAKAGALLESLTAWVEQFAFMMTKLPHQQADVLLGGPTALLKAQAGMVFKECADTAVLLFGGNGYTKTGQGQLVEMLYREVMGARIPGGSEDVLLDLAVRQLVKIYKTQTKMLEAAAGSKL
ncbi:mitochondrial long-chain specific acyl-CoA dehydrogenase [Staphylotrichum tortipilum]|uniref:Mitochondrial long-chain specific acyl-CoA dehydrogenase n=1 Tax=Staphylotrichum tortipilum TaxID=2831512 RepID=A0AAN6MGT0_9PEZI|nr:mitochondrial long-chain specific acyl-CoA dehydrogenase [Staphylotrichum longicolle]